MHIFDLNTAFNINVLHIYELITSAMLYAYIKWCPQCNDEFSDKPYLINVYIAHHRLWNKTRANLYSTSASSSLQKQN